MNHRHLDVPPEAVPEALGLAALDDLLDRGTLADWRPVARAIRRDPYGPVAERVAWLCDANPRQGTSRLWRAWIAHRRAIGGPRALADLRRDRGLTQAELAAKVGMSQSDLSKLERRTDVRVSTLRRVLAGLDLRLELVAVASAGPPRRSIVG